MELTIVGPMHKNTYDIAWLEIETTVGNFVIQPGHAPTMLILEKDRAATFCLLNGKQETITIPGGIAEITRSSASLILVS